MNASEFFTNIAMKVAAPFSEFKDAVDNKSVKEVFNATYKLIQAVVVVVENISKVMIEVELVLTGEEKKSMALQYLVDEAVVRVNERVNIPFLSEKQEAAIFRGILNILIDKAVAGFNKTGWE